MEWINLADDFFEGDKTYLDMNVKVLYGEGKHDIISQYVDFTKVYNKQVKLHGKTGEAVLETIRICKDRDVLREYLENGEKEVIGIMMALFDQQKAVEQYICEYAHEYARKVGNKKKIEGKMEGQKEAAINMRAEGLTDGTVARFLGVGVDLVQEWIAGSTAAKS